jgi:pilus assembly protein CpaB
MQLRTILIIGLAIFCGLTAVVGVNLFLRAQETNTREETVAVLVAAKDIDRLTTITADMLTTRPFPKSMVPKEALTNLDDVVGRRAKFKCQQNEMLLNSQLAEKGSGRAWDTPDGMRAFTIKTNKIAGAVTGFVLPGDRVDVLLTVTTEISKGKEGTLTVTLLTDIEVVAADYVTEPLQDKKAKIEDLKTVTLLVTPEQASKLALGENKGHLHLSLRNPNDKLPLPPTKITMKDIGLEPEAPPVKEAPLPAPKPKPKPAAPSHIRLLHGGSEAKIYPQANIQPLELPDPQEAEAKPFPRD